MNRTASRPLLHQLIMARAIIALGRLWPMKRGKNRLFSTLGYQPEEFYDWFSSKDYRVNLLGTGGNLSPLSLEQFAAKVAATSDAESFDCVGLPAPCQADS